MVAQAKFINPEGSPLPEHGTLLQGNVMLRVTGTRGDVVTAEILHLDLEKLQRISKKYVEVNEFFDYNVKTRIKQLRALNQSSRAMVHILNHEGLLPRGGRWHQTQIIRILQMIRREEAQKALAEESLQQTA